MIRIELDSSEKLVLKHSPWNTLPEKRLVVYLPPILFICLLLAIKGVFGYKLFTTIFFVWASFGSLFLVLDMLRDIVWTFHKDLQLIENTKEVPENLLFYKIWRCYVKKRLIATYKYKDIESIVLQSRELENCVEYRVALKLKDDRTYRNGLPIVWAFHESNNNFTVAEKIKNIMNLNEIENVEIPFIV